MSNDLVVVQEAQTDAQEVISLVSKLSNKQKELVLATLRGAVMIADSNTREE